LLELTKTPGFADRTHLVWPESAVPFALDNDARLRLAIAAVTPRGGLTITGALRVANDAARGVRVWNSVHAIDGAGALVASYDKFHLVPFGEYVPLRRYLTPLGVEKITAGAIDFTAGPGPATLDLPGLPSASPLICYEVIFPGEVVAPGKRPGWLVNLTNDAWFGITAGPHQHFASARFRAVEEGLPVVRAANNGISGVIDAYGRVTAHLALGRRGVVDAALPAALAPTPYARYGDMSLAALALIALGLAWALRRAV
jgi:apolipoprotein N-acyltransferase